MITAALVTTPALLAIPPTIASGVATARRHRTDAPINQAGVVNHDPV
jgi:hypothetical protein